MNKQNSEKLINLKVINGNWMSSNNINLPKGFNFTEKKLITKEGRIIDTDQYNITIDLKNKKLVFKKLKSNIKPFKITKEDIDRFNLRPAYKLGKVGIRPWYRVNISNQSTFWIWTDRRGITGVPGNRNRWSNNPPSGSQGIFYYVWYNDNSYKTVNIEAAMDDYGLIFVNNRLINSRPLGGGWGRGRVPTYRNIKVDNGYNTFKFIVQNRGSRPNPAGLAVNVSTIKYGKTINLFNTGMNNWYSGKNGWKYTTFNDIFAIKVTTNMNGGRYTSRGWDGIYTQLFDKYGYSQLFNGRPMYINNSGGIIRYELNNQFGGINILGRKPGWTLIQNGHYRVAIADSTDNLTPPFHKNWIKRIAVGNIFKVDKIVHLSSTKFDLKPAYKLGRVNIRPWNRTTISNQQAYWLWVDNKGTTSVPGNRLRTWSNNPPKDSQAIFYYIWYNDKNYTKVTIEAMMDDFGLIYINGELISSKPYGGGWGNSKTPTFNNVSVEKGFNLFKFKVQNGGTRPNPAGLAVNVFTVVNNRKVVLFHSGMNGWYSGKDGWNFLNVKKEHKQAHHEQAHHKTKHHDQAPHKTKHQEQAPHKTKHQEQAPHKTKHDDTSEQTKHDDTSEQTKDKKKITVSTIFLSLFLFSIIIGLIFYLSYITKTQVNNNE